MKGNIVLAAAVFAAGIVIASSILVLGVQSALNDAMPRLDASVRAHAKSVEQAGAAVGVPILKARDTLNAAVDKHANSIEKAGETISQLQVIMKGPVELAQPVQVIMKRPVELAQPVRIEGPLKDGALPVTPRLAK